MQARAVLDNPLAYKLFITITGGDRLRRNFAKNYVRAKKGDRILDIGCGPGNIVGHLPSVDYVGFDANPAYIENARQKWGDRGQFICSTVNDYALRSADFDIVLAVGILHHIDDEEAARLFQIAHDKLRAGGRLITFDGVYVKSQSPIARFLLSKDRGQYVRRLEQYESLASATFPKVMVHVLHGRLGPLPYTRLVMECAKDGRLTS
jgi:SAM-dependent methyltransferase